VRSAVRDGAVSEGVVPKVVEDRGTALSFFERRNCYNKMKYNYTIRGAGDREAEAAEK